MRRSERPNDGPIPAHPYRDSALVYGILASVLVMTAALTGADVVRASLVAVGFFVLATAWSGWRFRSRIKARAEQEAANGKVSGGGAANGDSDGADP